MHFFEFKVDSNNRVASIVLYTTHGAREISMCKNEEYKKAKSFIWMF